MIEVTHAELAVTRRNLEAQETWNQSLVELDKLADRAQRFAVVVFEVTR